MRERAEKYLKLVCWTLVAVLLLETGRAVVRNHPFSHVTIPAVPTLAADTNAAPAGGTIVAGSAMKAPANGPTNLPAGTNHSGTNLVAKLSATNMPPATNHGTNLPAILASVGTATNFSSQTNTIASSNAPGPVTGLASTNAGQGGTNGLLAAKNRKKSHSGRPSMMGMGMMFGMGGPGKPLPELPPVVKARIDKIVASELLGPVPHPLPMALLGIAGDTAFLRADSGETGLVKVGDSLGDLKLLRIGINRVLIEQDGQKQELTIFDGMGGDSLLTTSDKNSNETNRH